MQALAELVDVDTILAPSALSPTMANVFATFQRALRPCLSRHAPPRYSPALPARAIHLTPLALKQKQMPAAKSSKESDDLFGDDLDNDDSLFSSSSDDLFADTQSSKPKPTSRPAFTHAQDVPPHNPSVPISAHFDPQIRFDELHGFLQAYLVHKSEKRIPRTTAWSHLFSICSSPEHLQSAVSLMPKWRDFKRSFDHNVAEQFAQRCDILGCPQLALQVFGDRSKYALDLTMHAAHPALYSLLQHSPQDVLTFTSLFSIYNLPPVSSDLFCTAVLMRALFVQNSEESLTVAQSMVPSLEQLLQSTDLASMGSVKNQRTKTKQRLVSTLQALVEDFQSHGVDHGRLQAWLDSSANIV